MFPFCKEKGLDPAYLDGEINLWVSFEFAHSLIRRLLELSGGDENACFEAGMLGISPDTLGKPMFTAARVGLSEGYLYKTLIKISRLYNRVGEFRVRSLVRNRLVMEYTPKSGLRIWSCCTPVAQYTAFFPGLH